MKTLREIAADIGIDKSTVFRYVKTAGIQPQDSSTGTQYFDATAESAIKQHFEKKSVATQRRNVADLDTALESSRAAMHAIVQSQKRTIAELEKQHETDTERIAELDKRNIATVAERDVLRDQLNDAKADRETLIKQVNQYRQDFIDLKADHKEEVQRAQAHIDSLTAEKNKLREDHREELNRIQALYQKQLDDLTAERDQLRHDLNEERQHSRAQADTLAQLADQSQQLQLRQMQVPAIVAPPKLTLLQRIFGKRRTHDDAGE